MQSRELTSQAKIVTQLTTSQLPSSCTNTSIPSTENAQDQLNQIANQASNFGYGCGVALRKAIENGKKICKKLEKQLDDSRPGLFDYFFSSNKLYTFTQDAASFYHNDKVVKECNQYVSDMEEELKHWNQYKL